MTMLGIAKNEKGQGLTEYVLILAFVAGLAMMIFGGGLKETVASTFSETVEILANIDKEDLYKAAMQKWSRISTDDLKNASQNDRLAADLNGLQNLADWFINKDAETIKGVFGNDLSDKNGKIVLDIDERYNTGIKQKTGEMSRYRTADKTRNEATIAVMGGSTEGTIVSSDPTWTYSNQRYFYSDAMIDGSMHQVAVKLKYENGIVVSSEAYVKNKEELKATAAK